MNNILKQYKIQFSTPVDYAFKNKITSVNNLMSQIIGNYYRIDDVNVLLDAVNQVLAGTAESLEFDTQSLQIIVSNSTTTNFYEDMDAYEDNNAIAPYYSLPTQHFQVIVQAWRDYLVNSIVCGIKL